MQDVHTFVVSRSYVGGGLISSNHKFVMCCIYVLTDIPFTVLRRGVVINGLYRTLLPFLA